MLHSGKAVMTRLEENDGHHKTAKTMSKTTSTIAEKAIHTMLVVTEKHMQDANWVYYPFKNSHVLHGAVSF